MRVIRLFLHMHREFIGLLASFCLLWAAEAGFCDWIWMGCPGGRDGGLVTAPGVVLVLLAVYTLGHGSCGLATFSVMMYDACEMDLELGCWMVYGVVFDYSLLGADTVRLMCVSCES